MQIQGAVVANILLGALQCQCYTEKATKAWHRHGSQKHNKTNKATCTAVNLNDRMAPLINQAPDSTEKSNRESSCKTSTSVATLHRPQMHIASTAQTYSSANVRVDSVNTTQCSAQAGRAALLHRHHQLGHMEPLSRGARPHGKLVVNYRRTGSLPWGGDERIGGEGRRSGRDK